MKMICGGKVTIFCSLGRTHIEILLRIFGKGLFGGKGQENAGRAGRIPVAAIGKNKYYDRKSYRCDRNFYRCAGKTGGGICRAVRAFWRIVQTAVLFFPIFATVKRYYRKW